MKGDRFEVRGRGHVEWECDTVGLRTVVVDGRYARVYPGTRKVESCRRPDNPAGRGPWAISFSIDGRFEGGRRDALTASIQVCNDCRRMDSSLSIRYLSITIE